MGSERGTQVAGDLEGGSPHGSSGPARGSGTVGRRCGSRPLATQAQVHVGGRAWGMPSPTGLLTVWAGNYLGDQTPDFSLSRSSDMLGCPHPPGLGLPRPRHSCPLLPSCKAAAPRGLHGPSLSGPLGRWPGHAWFTMASGSGALGRSRAGRKLAGAQCATEVPVKTRRREGWGHRETRGVGVGEGLPGGDNSKLQE